jgi:predicted SnoaL-like aldol condensation-catalyzing enzyme
MRILFSVIAFLIIAAPAQAAVPVTGNPDHEAMLKSDDPRLEKMKRHAYDTWRYVVEARQMDEADRFIREDYIQHNPNAVTGLEGMKAYFRAQPGPFPVKDKVQRELVAIVAEGDKVVMSFVDHQKNSKGEDYTTTWFDMFRFEGDKIVEHWDTAHMP